MAKLSFGSIGENTSYPTNSYDSNTNQSYGFTDAFKVQTGNMRGTQTIGYGSVKLDGAHNRITVGGTGTNLILGDQSDTNNTFGFSVSDGTNPRLLAGEYPDGSIKIKLSQKGYDVNTATDDQLIWSSDFNSFKIVMSGTVSASPPASWTDSQVIRTTIVHGQTNIPAFLVYVTNPNTGVGYISSGLSNLPSSIYYPGGGGGAVLMSQAGVDNTNLYIDLINMTGVTATGFNTLSWTYKYYILKETSAST
jgi:hypothetical protein